MEHRHLHNWIRYAHRLQLFRTPKALTLALASSLILSAIMSLGAVDPVSHRFQSHFNIVYVVAANVLLFIFLYGYNFWLIRVGVKRTALVVAALAGSLAIAALFSLASFWAETHIYGSGHTSSSFTLTLVSNATAAIIAYLITLLQTSITNHQQTLLENEHLQAENLQVRYEALEKQVSPHFLFNSLNSLDSLIGSDDDLAHRFLHNLTAMFRYNMQEHRVVPLADELDFTHSYLYLMQIRYGDALRVVEDIDRGMLDRRVPHISLQLLLENAIKHNVATHRHPLEIHIQTLPEGALQVSNRLQPKSDSEPSSGIGLTNLDQRYQLLFNRNIVVKQDSGRFSVVIPLIA